MKLIAVLSFFLLSMNIASAQLEKTIHQTFDLQDAQTISLDLVGEYSIIPWAGDKVMTETKIELYDATPSILDHFVEKEERYLIKADTSQAAFHLYSANKKRDIIKTKTRQCMEVVQVKVYVPDSYEIRNGNTLVRIKQG